MMLNKYFNQDEFCNIRIALYKIAEKIEKRSHIDLFCCSKQQNRFFNITI